MCLVHLITYKKGALPIAGNAPNTKNYYGMITSLRISSYR